jgi:hypothetical protein
MASGGTGGLLSNTWAKTGPGTLTNSPGLVSIISDGATYTTATQEVTVRSGVPHRFSYTGEGFTFSRMLGVASGSGEYLTGAGTLGVNTHTFTPTTNKVWVRFQRLSANTAIANDLRLVELEPRPGTARLLNGTNQYFSQDNLTYGFPMTNSNFYIGGWWRLNTIPTTGARYFFDFGTSIDATGGGSRVRLIYDAVQNRLVASNQGSSGGYREHYIQNPGFAVNTPVYLGLAVKSDGEAYPILGTQRGGGTLSGSLPTITSNLGQQIRIGTTVRPTPLSTTYVHGSVWDVVWNVGSIPSDAILTSLAGGQRPHQISGFSPTYHWPMHLQSSTSDEESIAGLSTLRQVGSPVSVGTPIDPAPESTPSPFFII